MDRLIVRPMEEQDLSQVAAIEQEAFSTPWSLQSFRDSLGLPHAIFLIAEYEGEIAGYCGCYQSIEEGEITNVAVKRDFRRRGIARTLLEKLFRECRSRGIGSILLEVRAGNRAAIGLYESLGFEQAGIRRNFYEKPREDAVIMWKRFPISEQNIIL